MTTIHNEYLELAAAEIDFELSQAERAALAGHLAGCLPCRRSASGIHADHGAIAQMPPFVLAQADVDRVSFRIRQRGGSTRSTLRLVALAAVLTLLTVTAITVGATLLRRDRDQDLTVVPPTVSDPSERPSASFGPMRTPGPDEFAAGSTVDVVVSGLRVRTAPTVDNTKSAKLDPLLGRGTQLNVVEGPVRADDYDWYLVQAIGWPHRGWVAAADHDGSPWIEDRATTSLPAPAFSADESALVARLRDDAAVGCAPKRTGLPARSIAGVECQVNAAVVTRVGAYLFRDARDAATTYLERLASNDVKPATGDCRAGTIGDVAWMPGDGVAGNAADQVVVGSSGPWAVGRSGCFLDDNGTANVRTTCGSMYVGVVGRDGDLTGVDRWTRATPGGAAGVGEPPGICKSGA